MATRQKDLSQLKHSLVNGPLHFYSEVLADGTEVLRHIRAQQHVYQTPTDITVDGLPSGSVGTEQLKSGSVGKEQIKTGGVGTSQIEDQSVRLEDLSQEVREAMEAPVAAESDVRRIVNDYSPTQNT
ncbi:MAG: hypothetical protein IJV24_07425 [Prevotella sp.]|nr:hypothetical protein [Prevotella sp.]